MNKKHLLWGLVPAAIGMVTLSAACTKTYRYDTYNEKNIVISSGFATSNRQGKALAAVVKQYNEYVEANPGKGLLPVEITLTSGYSTDSLVNNLRSKEREKLPNIIINYPAAASLIAQYEMSLAMPDEDFASLNIADSFANFNESVALNNDNKKWTIPFSNSTEMLAVNQILLGKHLKELVDKGATKVEDQTTLIDKYIKAYETSSQLADDASDAKRIDKLWNPAKTPENVSWYTEALEATKKLQLSDSMFTNYKDLVNVVSIMKKFYARNSSLYLLGLDSFPNVVNSIVASLTGNDPDKNYITKNPSMATSAGYDYKSFIHDSNSQQYKTFKEAVDILFEGIRTGAIWIGGSGAYGSDSLTYHKLAISMGSTAGFTHTYIDTNKTKDHVLIADSDVILKNVTEYKWTADTKTLESADRNKNRIYFSDQNGSRDTNVNDKLKYHSILASTSADEKVLNWLRDVNGSSTKLYVSTDKELKVSSDGKVTKVIDGKTKEIPNAMLLKTFDSNAGPNKENADVDNQYGPFVLIKGDLLAKVTQNTTLQKNETDWLSTPLKATGAENETNSVFTQGPQFVLVHGNEVADPATLAFVKWMFTHQYETFKIEDSTYNNVTPINAFSIYANYISPTKDYFADDNPALSKLNEAQTLALNNFKKVNTDPTHYKTVVDVASVYSDLLRSSLSSTAKSLVNLSSQNPNITYDTFISSLKDSFVIQN